MQGYYKKVRDNIQEAKDDLTSHIADLHTMPRDAAVKHAHGVIDKHMKSTRPDIKFRLKNDISKARDSKRISQIMWNVNLSGGGHGVIGSKWSKEFHGAK